MNKEIEKIIGIALEEQRRLRTAIDDLKAENKNLKEIVHDFIIGFSINVFGIMPNGNSAFGCDEGEVRGNEYLRELLKRAELYAHTDIVDEMSVGVKNTNPDYYNHAKTSTDNNKGE